MKLEKRRAILVWQVRTTMKLEKRCANLAKLVHIRKNQELIVVNDVYQGNIQLELDNFQVIHVNTVLLVHFQMNQELVVVQVNALQEPIRRR